MRPFLMLTLASLLLGVAPAKPTIVTVTKSDGSTIRGTLGDVTPMDLNLTTIPKSSTQPAQGDAIKLAWADIKTVSTGLTQRRVIEFYKRDHPEDLCMDCHGDGNIICPTCHGTGRDAAAAKDCPTCHGAETIPCMTSKCDKGKIACPKTHIKLTEGNWFTKPDGKKWRKFPGRSGSLEVSEGHVGQIVEIKNGDPQTPIECPLCKGTMTIDDPKCHGSGLIPCNVCSTAALKDAKQKCKDCEKGLTKCKSCEGTGLKMFAKPPAT